MRFVPISNIIAYNLRLLLLLCPTADWLLIYTYATKISFYHNLHNIYYICIRVYSIIYTFSFGFGFLFVAVVVCKLYNSRTRKLSNDHNLCIPNKTVGNKNEIYSSPIPISCRFNSILFSKWMYVHNYVVNFCQSQQQLNCIKLCIEFHRYT